MRALSILAILAFTILPSVAFADAFDRLPEGAPLYAAARPISLSAALKRLGVDKLPEVQQLKQQLGVDPLDPVLLAPTGIDPAAPIAAALFEAAPGGRYHHRAVATLRDPIMFTTFIGAIGAAEQSPFKLADSGSPLGKLGVKASGKLPDGSIVIARLDGDTLVVDALGVWDSGSKKQKPTPMEVAKLYPLAVKAPFAAAQGARRLFAPEAAAVLYGDGRRMQSFLENADDPAPDAAGKKRMAKCRAGWSKAATTFDDAGVSLTVDAAGVELALAWGTQGGAPLGGLRFNPIDDGALDVDALAAGAPLSVALYAASLTPFQALKRAPVQATLDGLSDSMQKCGAMAWGHMLVRSWPQGLGAAFAEATKNSKQPADAMLAPVLRTVGQLRNLAFVLRGSDAQMIRGVLSSTFDPQARSMIELFLASAPGGGVDRTIGKRTPRVFTLNFGDLTGIVAALETLTSGPAAFTLADGEESLAWAFKAAPSVKAPGTPPLVAAHVDAVALARMPLLQQGGGESATRFLDALKRLRRLDARVTADGDLFRLSIRAAVKQ
jgi:hypothetical protein